VEVFTCKASTGEAEAKKSKVKGYPELYSKFKGSLRYVAIFYVQKKKKH
jgi:hypothetical protein